MESSRRWAASAPSRDDIHLSFFFFFFCFFACGVQLSGITSHFTGSGALTQNDSYSLCKNHQ